MFERLHIPRGRLAATVVLTASLAVACGKSGRPLPPEPRGPRAPEGVAARQIGERAVVHVTVPRARGDRPSQQPVEVELVRVTYPPGFDPPPDAEAFRRRGETVGSAFGDPLETGARVSIRDDDLAARQGGAPGSLMRYAVRVLDRRGRPSPLVVATDLRLLPDVPPPTGLRGEPTADGIRLRWSGEGTFRVYRREPGAAWPELPVHAVKPLEVAEYLDGEVVTGATYEYTVRAVLAPGTPYRESLGADPVTIVAEDRFPPEAPTGLTAVQEGPAVRLFWNPSPERDLAGYRVERSVDGGEWLQIGPDPVEQPSLLDTDVRPGQVVAYRVRALDRSSPPNVGEASPPVRRELVDDGGLDTP